MHRPRCVSVWHVIAARYSWLNGRPFMQNWQCRIAPNPNSVSYWVLAIAAFASASTVPLARSFCLLNILHIHTAVLEAHERSRIVLFGYTLTYSTPHRMTWVSVYSVPILFVGMFKKLRIDTLEFSLRATTCKKGRANSHPRNTTTNQFIYTEKQKKNNNIRKQKFCRFLLYFKFLVSPVNYSVENVVQSTKITSRIFPPKISKIELSIHFKLSNACLE